MGTPLWDFRLLKELQELNKKSYHKFEYPSEIEFIKNTEELDENGDQITTEFRLIEIDEGLDQLVDPDEIVAPAAIIINYEYGFEKKFPFLHTAADKFAFTRVELLESIYRTYDEIYETNDSVYGIWKDFGDLFIFGIKSTDQELAGLPVYEAMS